MAYNNSRPVITMAVLVMLAGGMIVLAFHASPGMALAGNAGAESPTGAVLPATTRTPAPADNPAAMTAGAATPSGTPLPASARVTTTAARYNGSVNIPEEEALLRLRKDYPDYLFPLVSITLDDSSFDRILYACTITDTGDPAKPSDDKNLTVYIDAGTGNYFRPGEEKAGITIQQAEEAVKKAFPDIAADGIRVKFTDYDTQGMGAWEFGMIRDGTEFLSGILDADTGEVLQYHRFPFSFEDAGSAPVTRDGARAIADTEFRKRNGELSVRVIDNQSSRYAGFSGLPDPGSYSFRYERIINTVPCGSDSIIINVDATTGTIGMYAKRWVVPEGAVAASAVPAIAKDAAVAIVEKEARARFPESAGSLRIITADLLWMDECNVYKTTPAPGSIPLGWNVAFDDAAIRAQEYPNRGSAWVDAQNGTLLQIHYIHPPLYFSDPEEQVIAEYGMDTARTEDSNPENPVFVPGNFIAIIQPDLKPYITPEGPVRGMGRQSNGLVTVKIDQDWTLNQTVIDEIHEVIAARAREYGVDPVPCRFTWETDVTTG